MSHNIYSTEAIILGQVHKGETASILTLFTREYGLVYAHANGLRKMESKLRNSLQNYSHTEISLVRGREVWRVVNAREHLFLPDIRNDKNKRLLSVQLLMLLKRFLGQDEPHTDLFDDIVLAFRFLDETRLKAEELSRFELLMVLRILFRLGYLREDLKIKNEIIPFKEILDFSEWKKEVMDPIEGREKECILTINESFSASGL